MVRLKPMVGRENVPLISSKDCNDLQHVKYQLYAPSKDLYTSLKKHKPFSQHPVEQNIYRNKRTCLFIWAWVPIYSTRPCPLLQPFEHELIYSKFFDFLPNGMEFHIQKTKDCPQSANLKSISEALLRGASSRETNKKPLVN